MRLAGVSQSTVSLVVNNNPSVAQGTRDRVNHAIQELGFRANRSVQNLRGLPSRIIGFVTNQMATTPFAGQTILGAQQAAWKQGYVLLVVDVGGSTELTDTAIDILVDQDVSGFIYASMTPAKVCKPFALHQVPSVIVNADPDGLEAFCRVELGNFDGVFSRPEPFWPPAIGEFSFCRVRPTVSSRSTANPDFAPFSPRFQKMRWISKCRTAPTRSAPVTSACGR